MLDVHPPEHTPHSWREFFIHIATIVVGLIIAVGLEQAVEHIHQRYQLSETRDALKRERAENRVELASDMRTWRWVTAELQNNLLLLEYIRQHPGTPQTALPGDLEWDQRPFEYQYAVWDSAKQNGIVQLMPLDEANANQQFYDGLTFINKQNLDVWNADNDAFRFDLLDPDPTHLSPQQLAKVTTLTEVLIEKQIEMGYSLAHVAQQYPDMPQLLTYIDMQHLHPEPFTLNPTGMAAAHQRSMDAIKAAGYTGP